MSYLATFVRFFTIFALIVKEAIKLIEGDGWYQLKLNGTSHRQFKHPVKKGRVTISGHLSADLDPGTLNSILKQAGLK